MSEDDELRERVRRKRLARRLVTGWLAFTPCPVVDGRTKLEPGDVAIQVTVRVLAMDLDRKLVKP